MYPSASRGSISLNFLHNKPSPIETLPVEVFYVIVRQVVKKALRPPCADEGYFRDLMNLRLVCTRWAQAIEGNPEFWQRLSLHSGEEFVRLTIKRTLGWPLDICGTVKSTSVVDLALRESLRWRTVDVQINGQTDLDLLLSRPAPLLESLAMRTPGPGIKAPSLILFNNDAPRLQAVKLIGCPLPWSSSTLPGLRELRICSIRETVRYRIFLDVLKRSPELTHLAIDCTKFDLLDSRTRRITLHKLRSFELKDLNRSVMETLMYLIEVPISANRRYAGRLKEDDIVEDVLSPLFDGLEVLAKFSRDLPWTLRMAMGGPTRWTRDGWDDTLAGEATLEYRGSHPHGTISIVVTSEPRRHTDIFDYFVGRLAGLVPNQIPPSLHFIRLHPISPTDPSSNILAKIDRHFPRVREIVIQDTSHQSRVRALSWLFLPTTEKSRLFRCLSSVTLQAPYHDDWVAWLENWRTRLGNSTATEPPPFTTLRVKDGVIGPDKVDVLKALVPDLILDDVKVK
ncbi:hypothetical protein FS837_003758 [Tulasnella sp. UAMH 9824]|nr:hypothetical protein FS837_003758 [Tulasnella sp. UAMH 9824]